MYVEPEAARVESTGLFTDQHDPRAAQLALFPLWVQIIDPLRHDLPEDRVAQKLTVCPGAA